MLSKTIVLNFLLIFSFGDLEAQIHKDATPLHAFFQRNFDSTIIYHQWSSWYPYPKYDIIAKKDSSVYYFTYKSAYANVQGRYYPADLQRKFLQEEAKFTSTCPDTNRYFLPVFIPSAERHQYWAQINSFDVWKLKEENENSSECDVQDEGSDTYYLITNQGVEVKTFYAPAFYERCQPGNVNRINEIKTRNIILKTFGD